MLDPAIPSPEAGLVRGRSARSRSFRNVGCAFLLSALTACSPQVYREDVGTFSAGVTAATDTFALLQVEDLNRQQAAIEEEIVSRRAQAGITDDCEETLLKLQRDAACLGDWAAFRRGERGQPACQEFKGFYTLPPDAGAKCRLGVESGLGFQPAGPEPQLAYPLLGEANRQLQAYADGLTEITAAEDGEALRSALGNARDALVKLDERVGTLSGRTPTANAAVGPVADLFGSALYTALEARRYRALKSIVNKADPTVSEAAMLLSQAALPLLVRARLRPAQQSLQNLAERARPSGPRDEHYPERVTAASRALDAYRVQLAADPSGVFAAMADAHTKLAREINDPGTQFEAMKSAVNDFAARAKAAYAAIEAQRAAERVDRPTPADAGLSGSTAGPR